MEDLRNKKTRRTQSSPIATMKSSTTTAKHGKGGNYQHVEHHGGIGGAAVADGGRNTSFLDLVRGLVSRR